MTNHTHEVYSNSGSVMNFWSIETAIDAYKLMQRVFGSGGGWHIRRAGHTINLNPTTIRMPP